MRLCSSQLEEQEGWFRSGEHLASNRGPAAEGRRSWPADVCGIVSKGERTRVYHAYRPIVAERQYFKST